MNAEPAALKEALTDSASTFRCSGALDKTDFGARQEGSW